MHRYSELDRYCRQILTQSFNTTEAHLDSLSSELIKQGQFTALETPLETPLAEPELAQGERFALQPQPGFIAGQPKENPSTCSYVTIQYDDILYVPAHPSTGEKAWYAVTKTAKEALLAERDTLDAAVIKEKPSETLKNLNKLGILSTFMTKAFEQFLSPDGAKDYRTLLWLKTIITRKVYMDTEDDPIMFLLLVSEHLEMDHAALAKHVADTRLFMQRWDTYMQSKADYLVAQKAKNRGGDSLTGAAITAQDKGLKKQLPPEQNLIDHLSHKVVETIDEKTERYENHAKRMAWKQVADDGTQFEYVDDLKYFTSAHEKWLQSAYQTVLGSLPNDDELTLKSPNEAREILTQWQACISGQVVMIDQPHGMYPHSSQLKTELLIRCLRSLNQHGIAIKNQCFHVDELVGKNTDNHDISLGPLTLQQYMPNWRGEEGWFSDAHISPLDIGNDTLINKLYTELRGEVGETGRYAIKDIINHMDYSWAYYPTLALIKLVDVTLEKHQNALHNLFGRDMPVDELLSKLIWVKKMAQARIALLKEIAQQLASRGVQHLAVVPSDLTDPPSEFTVLWDDKYTPKPKHFGGFKNDAGLNNLQITECALLSDGQVFYVRAPHWYLPNPDDMRQKAQGLSHVKNLTPRISFQQAQSGSDLEPKSLNEALNELKSPSVTINLYSLSQSEQFDTAFWQNSYHAREGISPDGQEGALNMEAGAQLFRFTSEAKGEINLPLNRYEKGKASLRTMGISGGMSATLSLAQAQASISCWLPLRPENTQQTNPEKVKGWVIALPYINSEDTQKTHNCGEVCIRLQGSVYGLAAATCQVSAEVAIGPSDVSTGNIGIKGHAIGGFDSNIRRVHVIGNGPLSHISPKIGAHANAKVDVFAGVEAGGSIGAQVWWRPPYKATTQDTPPQPEMLGSIDGSLSVSAGVGISGDYKLAFQGGVAVFYAKGKFTKGLGVGNSIAITLDTQSLDAFVDTLLGVLKREDYRRLSVFGEVDEHGKNPDFEVLNQMLTTAVMLGLNIADVMLMPASLYAKYQERTQQKEYAPFIATRMMRKETRAKMQVWITKLPPETLCTVFNSLIQSRTENYQEFTPAQCNQIQAQAIVQAMTWLKEDGDINGGAQRRFKETLIRMSGDPHILDNKPLQWQAFQENWFRLGLFVKKYGTSAESSELLRQFNFNSSNLCESMTLVYRDIEKIEYSHSYPSSAPATIKERQYSTYPVSQLVRVGMMQDKSGSVPQTVQAVDIKGEVLPDILTIAPWEINYAR